LGLRSLGHDVVPILPGGGWNFRKPWKRLEGLVYHAPGDIKDRVIVLVDVAGAKALGEWESLPAKGSRVYMIDHHVPDDNTYHHPGWIVPQAPSASELVWWLLRDLKCSRKALREAARALYAGVWCDTGGLRYQGVNTHTFQAVTEMVKHGVDPARMADWMKTTRSHQDTIAYGKALASVQIEKGIAWVLIEDAEVGNRIKQSLSQDILSVRGVEMSAILYPDADGWRASLRSPLDGVNVQQIAKALGGGGHKHAAGGIHGETGEELLIQLQEAYSSVVSTE
jgi:phosphoesterase RecJ-like protein